MAEIVLLVVAAIFPLVLGALADQLGRPWWWAALVAVILFVLTAILPEPEIGESRVAAGDLPFLLVVGLVVAGLTWLGAMLHRRLTRDR